jgi:hypothetical protein
LTILRSGRGGDIFPALRGGAGAATLAVASLRGVANVVAAHTRMRFVMLPTLKVSVLLCTVTFYANLAHSLTRSL